MCDEIPLKRVLYSEVVVPTYVSRENNLFQSDDETRFPRISNRLEWSLVLPQDVTYIIIIHSSRVPGKESY